MPLNTRIIRDAQPVTMPHGWGWWHVTCMAKAIQAEHPDQDLDFMAALNKCPVTLTQDHTFTDPADGEVLTLQPGDVLDAWRDR